LSDDGRRQAEAAAARVVALTARGNGSGGAKAGGDGKAGKSDKAGAPSAVVYASPLERTQETAAPIAAALGVEVVPDDGLLELDMGEWTGLPLATARKRKEWSTIQRYPSSFRFPGGESFVDMQARMASTVDRLRAEHPGQMVVAVSHADPIRALVAHAMGTHLDLFQRIVVSPCSLTGIAYGSEGPVVLMVNATDDSRALVPS
jgi:probable phosphoglycerate mutase